MPRPWSTSTSRAGGRDSPAAGRRLEGRPAGPLIATATPAGLGQALDVLLENALRHGIQGAVVQATAGEDEVSVSVSDDGPGVPPGEEERIFDRNVSLHGGTGIGLAVARALVERDGGRLRLARARPPRFEILLPSR